MSEPNGATILDQLSVLKSAIDKAGTGEMAAVKFLTKLAEDGYDFFLVRAPKRAQTQPEQPSMEV
jgi:hypothetical protein